MFSCQATEQKAGKQKVESILVESVDIETYGKKSGSTHFGIADSEYFLDYEYFDSAELATQKLKEAESRAERTLSKREVVDSRGTKIGILVTIHRDEQKAYCLVWTKVNRLTTVCTESSNGVSIFLDAYEI